ncbi:MAG TPA: cyclic nucleotide-binding domain-containing protein [Abditibacterium sp.]
MPADPASPLASLRVPVSFDDCRHAFSSIPHLSGLPDSDCLALSPLMCARDFPAGSNLFFEDDESDGAFFLVSGAVEVFKSSPEGRKLPLVVLRDGGLLGEIGLLVGERRTATVRALSGVRALELDRFTFNRAVETHNEAALRLSLALARVLAQRLTATNEKLFDLFRNDVSDTLHRQLSDMQTRLLTRWTG